MIFKMNNLNWEIKEVSAEEVRKVFNDDNPDSYYFGCVTKSNQTVLINKEISEEKKRETLYHELMHCYLYCYIIDEMENIEEETLCNISAKSHDIIHKIVDDYFKMKK